MNTQEKLQKIINLKTGIASFCAGKEEIQKGVFFGKDVSVEPNVFFDVSGGIIVIGDNTKIKAGAVLRGPLLIGAHCRIGGEMQHTIMENYSNKQHYGYVGYSYIGAWVNLGGGTSTATLKNTYGNITLEGNDTGQQFLGVILGDYVKTAVNSSIFPGKVIGAGANLYGMITEDVPAFTSSTPGGLYEIPIEVTLKAQKAMMERRNVTLTKEDEEKITELYKQTDGEREKAKVKKEKLQFK